MMIASAMVSRVVSTLRQQPGVSHAQYSRVHMLHQMLPGTATLLHSQRHLHLYACSSASEGTPLKLSPMSESSTMSIRSATEVVSAPEDSLSVVMEGSLPRGEPECSPMGDSGLLPEGPSNSEAELKEPNDSGASGAEAINEEL